MEKSDMNFEFPAPASMPGRDAHFLAFFPPPPPVVFLSVQIFLLISPQLRLVYVRSGE